MNASTRIVVGLCLVGLLSFFGCAPGRTPSVEAWSRFEREHPSPALRVAWRRSMAAPRLITGLAVKPPQGLEEPKNHDDVSKIVVAFLRKNQDLLRVPVDDLTLKRTWKYRNTWHVTYQTHYGELPISSGQVGLTLDEGGNILTYSSNYDPGLDLETKALISRKKALEIAHANHKPQVDLPVTPKELSLLVHRDQARDGRTTYRLAWTVFLATRAGHAGVDRVFIIDARTGKLIQEFFPYPSAITGTVRGETYPVHSTDAVVTVPFEHAQVSVSGHSTNTNSSGSYTLNPGSGTYTVTTRLEGPHAKVQSYNATTATDQDVALTANGVSDPGTQDFTWTSANCAPDDGDGLTVFWQANRFHDDYYVAVLGTSWTHDWSGTSQMRYSVNRGAVNNAFAGEVITIYSDAAARNCDIVFHETAHNVLYNVFGGSWIGWPASHSEGYAFDEGFADYFACSFNNDSVFAENVFTTRDCDNTMQYPGTTYNIEGHTGGQLISGVAWDLWNKEGLSHNAVDVLLFAGLNQMATLASPYYFSDPGNSNYLDALLTADDDNSNVADGTPSDRQIFQAFRNHDLLPVDVFCKDSAQDDGNVPSAGYHWTSPDIWVRNAQDGGTAHQNPIYGQANYIYVKVRNLGYLTATTVDVKAYWADPAGGIPWPGDWHYVGERQVTNLAADGETTILPISWTPSGTAVGHRCLLVRLECGQDRMTEEGNVKLDNNIAQKNITIIQLPPGRPSGAEPAETPFFIKNYPEARNNLIVTVARTKAGGLGPPRPPGEVKLPFRVELDVLGLRSVGDIAGGECRAIPRIFRPWSPAALAMGRPHKHRFVMKRNRAVITDMRFADSVNKALALLRIVPTEELRRGDVYEVNVMQSRGTRPMGMRVVGGLTYIVRVGIR